MPNGVRIGLELLHDQVVVLAGLDEGAVLADSRADLFVRRALTSFLAGRRPSRVRRRRRACRRSAAGRALRSWWPAATGRCRTRSCTDWRRPCRRPATFLASALKICSSVRSIAGAGLGVGEHDAVEADLDLDRVTPSGRSFDFAVLDRARGVGDVGVFSPTPSQNSLMPPPVPVELDDRGLNLPALAELLGDGGGERKHGRRTDDLDLVAGGGVAGRGGKREGRGRRRED